MTILNHSRRRNMVLLKPLDEHLLPTLSGKSPRHPFFICLWLFGKYCYPRSHWVVTLRLWSCGFKHGGDPVWRWILEPGFPDTLIPELSVSLSTMELSFHVTNGPETWSRMILQWVCLDFKAQMQWNAPTPHHVSHTLSENIEILGAGSDWSVRNEACHSFKNLLWLCLMDRWVLTLQHNS